jgi:hypothetical protein
MAQALPPGHRLRVALSTSYWPLVWPPPEPVRLSVFTGSSRLVLPVRPVGEREEMPLRPFDDPEGTPPIPVSQLVAGDERWTVSRDLVRYTSALEVVKDLGVIRFDDSGLEVARRAYERYGWVGDDFGSVRGETEWTVVFEREGWKASTTTHTVLTSSATDFHIHAELRAYEGGRIVATHEWDRTVPRDLV